MSTSADNLTPPPLGDLHAGEPKAWRQAFGLLWGPALRAARRHLADAGEAEEVAAQALQETRLAVASTRSWEEVGALAVVIARRRAISRIRAQTALKRSSGSAVSLDNEALLESAEAPQYAALRALDVQSILAALSLTHRELLQDYFIHGLTSDEVAQKRGMPAATVRSQIMRLLALLRERQEGRRNSQPRNRDSHSGTAS